MKAPYSQQRKAEGEGNGDQGAALAQGPNTYEAGYGDVTAYSEE